MKFNPIGARVREQDLSHIRMSDSEIAGLVRAYRRYGSFRQEIESGQCFFSQEAYEIYGVPFTERSADIPALVRRTHPDDIELVTSTFETAARERRSFHLVHRYESELGDYKWIRLVVKVREGRVPGGEFIGVIYEFYDHLSVMAFEGG
jgi:hypothetical protein